MSDFGKTFKNARQSLGLTLEQIAAETRIGTRFLEAIETEQFHVLPGGIFSRGFVRSYAERLKLDPEKAVADFERQSSSDVPVLMEDPQVTAPPPIKKNRGLYTVALGTLVVLIVGFYIVTRESTRSVNPEQPVMHAATPAPAPVAAPSVTSPPPVAATPPAAAVEEPAPQPAAETASQAARAVTPAPTEAANPQGLTIVLSAREVAWIKVLADKTTVNAGETLQPGTTRRYTAQSSVGLSVGNAGGVDIQVNDHTLRPLGKRGQVRSIKITPENLKDLLD